MEEKERYIIGKGENISIVDNDQKVIFNITTKKLQDLLNQQNKQIKELEEQLKNAIRFKTPQIERFAVVQYVHRKGKPYKIEHCYDCYKDENMKTVYCYYGCDSYNFRVIQICATKEEAQAKLKELQGENNGNTNNN